MNFDWESWIERNPVGAVLLVVAFIVLLSLGTDDTSEAQDRAETKECAK